MANRLIEAMRAHEKAANGADEAVADTPKRLKAAKEIAKETERKVTLLVAPLKEEIFECRIVGTSPLMSHAFSGRSIEKMVATHKGGEAARGKRVREERNFEKDCEGATHWMLDEKGKKVPGLPINAVRSAMISACRTCGVKMTVAKLALLGLVPDGRDTVSSLPLFKIYGEWEMNIGPARNDDGSMDLRSRPLWNEWHADIAFCYDAGLLTEQSIANLLYRAGRQVGIGEGRPDSRNSSGFGFGLFKIEGGK